MFSLKFKDLLHLKTPQCLLDCLGETKASREINLLSLSSETLENQACHSNMQA